MFHPIINQLESEFVRRRDIYENAIKKFGLSAKPKTMDNNEIYECAIVLLTEYSATRRIIACESFEMCNE